MKPGSTTNELNETAKDEVRKLSHEDAIIICSGTNDYELHKFSQIFHNTMSFINNNKHTVLLMNVPYRHDLPNATC